MSYSLVKNLEPTEFKRLCGVTSATFEQMVKVVAAEKVLVDQKTQEIICVAVREGKVDDFRIWKESQIGIEKKTELLADKGYQGIKNIHSHSRTPIKKTKKKTLSKDQKKFNKRLAKERIIVEHVHRRLKIFRILSSRYKPRAT